MLHSSSHYRSISKSGFAFSASLVSTATPRKLRRSLQLSFSSYRTASLTPPSTRIHNIHTSRAFKMASDMSEMSREQLLAKLASLEEVIAKQQLVGTSNSVDHLRGPVEVQKAAAGPSLRDSEESTPSIPVKNSNARSTSSSSVTPAGLSVKLSKPKPSRAHLFHTHPTRRIALLFTYQGWPYYGLALQTPASDAFPTVESHLLAALEKTHLIEPGKGWEGCGFSRCGRTDRGVSSAGQVATFRVKSKRFRGDGGEELGDDWMEPQMPSEEKKHTKAAVTQQELNRESLNAESSSSKMDPTADSAANSESDAESLPDTFTPPNRFKDPEYRQSLLDSFQQCSNTEERIAWSLHHQITPNYMTKEQKKRIRAEPSLGQAIRLEALQAFLEGRQAPRKPKRKTRALKGRPTDFADQSKPTEYAYVSMLNRVLPSEIRVLAWSPMISDPQMDARFSCQTRHYRYYFSSRPIPGQPALDLAKMQQAADLLIGEHDFRNFCKLDGSKQIENYCRTIIKATIRVRPKGPTTVDPQQRHDDEIRNQQPEEDEDCAFELIGSAFLWHQVRHIMGILFLVGHGLEPPSIVTSLLNVGPQDHLTIISTPDSPLRLPDPQPLDCDTPFVKTKPAYNMAAALPLQLYACAYEPDIVQWRYGSFDGPLSSDVDGAAKRAANEGNSTLLIHLRNQLSEAKVKAQQIEAFYQEALRITGGPDKESGEEIAHFTLGASEIGSSKKYIPLLQRPRGESIQDVNRKYREGAGARRSARKALECNAGGSDAE